jgi:hypothetical protein
MMLHQAFMDLALFVVALRTMSVQPALSTAYLRNERVQSSGLSLGDPVMVGFGD